MTVEITLKQAVLELTRCIRKGLVPMLHGSPGEGKSAVVKKVAKNLKLKVIDIRLAQCDPSDLNGFPKVDDETGKACYMPMENFPLMGDKIPEGYDGWLIFLDEINSAPRAIQSAAYKLVYDHQVGLHDLHPQAFIACAGNLETDNAIVEPMSTAMQSRLIHFFLAKTVQEWLDWAASKSVNHMIQSYIKWKPDALYGFDPNHSDFTFACKRTWEFASKLMKDEDVGPHLLPCLAGSLSEGVAREFLGFCGIYEDLPSINDILERPEEISVPSEPSVIYALTGNIAAQATTENLSQLMPFIKRIPAEFRVITLRSIVQRDVNNWMKHPIIVEWMKSNDAKDLF